MQEILEADTHRRIAERLPVVGLTFALVLGVAWIFEHQSFPERDLVYGVLYGIELAVLALAAWLLRPHRLQHRAPIVATATGTALVVCVCLYHIIVRSSGDVLALALLYIMVGSMVSIPWG